MAFSTKPKASAPAQTQERTRTPASKPDYLLKIKNEGDEKWTRVGGMWFDKEKNSYKITLDEGVELKSTAEDRVKINVFSNDFVAKK